MGYAAAPKECVIARGVDPVGVKLQARGDRGKRGGRRSRVNIGMCMYDYTMPRKRVWKNSKTRSDLAMEVQIDYMRSDVIELK